MSEGVGNCLVSRADGQPVRISTYDEAGDNGFMIIYGDNGIVMYDVETQTAIHKASWDF